MGYITFNVAAESAGYTGDPITWLMHTDGGTDSQAVILENGGSQNNINDYAYKSDILQDGRVVIASYEPDVTITCFEVGSTTSVSWSTELTGEVFYSYCNIKVLTNNTIAVSYVDTDEYGKYAILDSDGNILYGPLRYDGNNGSYEEYDSMIALPDGGFAIIYDQYPGTDTDWIAIRNADGTSRADVEPSYADYRDGANQINVFPDGIIARFMDNTSDLGLYTFNPTTGVEILSGADKWSTVCTGYFIKSAALSTWTDKLAVFFRGPGDGSSGGSIYGTIIHSDGTHPDVYDKVVYTRYFSSGLVNVIDVVVNQDDQFILHFEDSGTTAGDGEKYLVLDSNLDVVGDADGTTAFIGDPADVSPWMEGCAI